MGGGAFSLGPWEDSLEVVSGMDVGTLRPTRQAGQDGRGSEAGRRMDSSGWGAAAWRDPSRVGLLEGAYLAGAGTEDLWLRRKQGEKQLLTQLLGAPGDGCGQRSSSECDVGAPGVKHSPHFPRILGTDVQGQRCWADRQTICSMLERSPCQAQAPGATGTGS